MNYINTKTNEIFTYDELIKKLLSLTTEEEKEFLSNVKTTTN